MLLNGRGYRPLGEVLDARNRVFYGLPRIALPFETTDSRELLTISADAGRFYQRLSSSDGPFLGQEEITAHFWGIGYAGAHRHFWELLAAKDRSLGTDHLSRTSIIVGDFSREVLITDLERNPFARQVLFDAAKRLPFASESADYIRFNELYDDLPGSEFIVKMGRNYYVLMGRLLLDPEHPIKTMCGTPVSPQEFIVERWPKGIEGLSDLDPSFLNAITHQAAPAKIGSIREHPAYEFIRDAYKDQEEIAFPLNWGAKRNLEEALRILKLGGCVDFFDYGFFDPQFIIDYRSSIVRTIAGQPTVLVNFPFLIGGLDESRFIVTAEPQAHYLSRNYGLRFLSNVFLTENEEAVKAMLPKLDELEGYPHISDLAQELCGSAQEAGSREDSLHLHVISILNSLAKDRYWLTSQDIVSAICAVGFCLPAAQRAAHNITFASYGVPDGGLYHIFIEKR